MHWGERHLTKCGNSVIPVSERLTPCQVKVMCSGPHTLTLLLCNPKRKSGTANWASHAISFRTVGRTEEVLASQSRHLHARQQFASRGMQKERPSKLGKSASNSRSVARGFMTSDLHVRMSRVLLAVLPSSHLRSACSPTEGPAEHRLI